MKPLLLLILTLLAISGLSQTALNQPSTTPPSSVHSSKPGAVSPLIMLGRSPAFYAEINGHRALLELDTGSFELRISPKFAQDNGISTTPVELKLGEGMTERLTPLIEALSDPDQQTFADKISLHSDGIAGLDVLRKYAIGLDYQDNEVCFWPGGGVGKEIADQWTALTSEKHPVDMAILPISTKSEEDWYRVKSLINGRELDLILDTGTAISTVNPSISAALHLKTIGETEVEEIGHSETLSIVQAETIKFGPLAALFPILNVESEESKDSDGILGSEALGQGRFILDFPDLKVYIRRFSHYRDTNPLEVRLRNAGLDFFPDSHQHLVVMVAPGSVADKAGIKSGDRLAAIGKITVTQLFGLFGGAPDPASKTDLFATSLELMKKDLTVTIENDEGKQIVISLPRANQFS